MRFAALALLAGLSFGGCSEKRTAEPPLGAATTPINQWRLDPSRRTPRDNQPIRAAFAPITAPKVGDSFTVSLNMEPLIDAPKLVIRLVPPIGLTIFDPLNTTMDNVTAGKQYSLTVRCRLDAADTRPLLAAVDLPFPPIANFHTQASMKVGNKDTMDPMPGHEELISGMRIRAVPLNASATAPR